MYLKKYNICDQVGRTVSNILIFLILVSSILIIGNLSGCSGDKNALTIVPDDIAAQFLVAASKSAEKKLGVFTPPGGSYYGRCMNGQEQSAWCQRLYQNMIDFAHASKSFTQFNDLTMANLTNRKVFEKLADEYQKTWFDAV